MKQKKSSSKLFSLSQIIVILFFVVDIGQLPLFIRFENAGNTCWFNSIFQMLLPSSHTVETIRKSHIIDDDLVPCKVMVLSGIINAFISKSMNCHADRRKAVINKTFIKISALGWL